MSTQDKNDAKTQLVVIGAGPGGYAAAFLAADLGMDVTVVHLMDTLMERQLDERAASDLRGVAAPVVGGGRNRVVEVVRGERLEEGHLPQPAIQSKEIHS